MKEYLDILESMNYDYSEEYVLIAVDNKVITKASDLVLAINSEFKQIYILSDINSDIVELTIDKDKYGHITYSMSTPKGSTAEVAEALYMLYELD